MNHRDVSHPKAGGAERTIYEVGKRLVLRGHEVDLLTGSWRAALRHETIDGTSLPNLVQFDRILRVSTLTKQC